MFEENSEASTKLTVTTKRILLGENNDALRLWLICVYEALENQNKTIAFNGREFELGELNFVSNRGTIAKLFNHNTNAAPLDEKQVYVLLEYLELRGYINLWDENDHLNINL